MSSDTKEVTLGGFLGVLRDNWIFIVVLAGVVTGWFDLKKEVQNNTAQILSASIKAQANENWRVDWERNGQLPEDITQNSQIAELQSRVSRIEKLNLEARLTAIEVNQTNMKDNQKKIEALLLDLKRLFLKQQMIEGSGHDDR